MVPHRSDPRWPERLRSGSIHASIVASAGASSCAARTVASRVTMRKPDPLYVPFRGREVRVRHDDPRLGPYTPTAAVLRSAAGARHHPARDEGAGRQSGRHGRGPTQGHDRLRMRARPTVAAERWQQDSRSGCMPVGHPGPIGRRQAHRFPRSWHACGARSWPVHTDRAALALRSVRYVDRAEQGHRPSLHH